MCMGRIKAPLLPLHSDPAMAGHSSEKTQHVLKKIPLRWRLLLPVLQFTVVIGVLMVYYR